MSYVIKCRGKYARFGSYRTMTLVDKPENATIYSRLKDVEKRYKDDVFYLKKGSVSCVLDKIEIYEIIFTHTEKKVKR